MPLHELLSLQPALDVGLLAVAARCSRCASDQRKHSRVAGIQRRHFMETDLAAGFTRSQIEGVLVGVEATAGQRAAFELQFDRGWRAFLDPPANRSCAEFGKACHVFLPERQPDSRVRLMLYGNLIKQVNPNYFRQFLFGMIWCDVILTATPCYF